MTNEAIAKYVKAVGALLSCLGVVVSPENLKNIAVGFAAGYAVVEAIEAKFFKSKEVK